MVDEISGVASLHSTSGQAGAVVAQRGLATVQSDVVLPLAGYSEPKPSQASTSLQVVGIYSQLRVRQDELNKAASFLREVGDALGKAAETLDKMGKDLGKIVKIYPPYPTDDPERIDLLNQFGGLRREIEALTFPPPDHLDAVGRLLGREDGKAAEEGKLTPGNDAIVGIPTLDPKAASDEEVKQAFEQVKALKSAVEDIRSGMWKDVVDYVRQADTPEARNHATETRDQLAALGFGQGIATDARQLQQVVESN